MTAVPDQLKQAIEAAGQTQVLKFWDKLTDDEKAPLLKQLEAIEFDKVNEYFKRCMAPPSETDEKVKSDSRLKPVPKENTGSAITGDAESKKNWRTKGLQAVAAGEVAVLLLAGGQGTRLGSSAPKGCYDVGLPSKKSLFQIQAEKIRRVAKLAQDQAGLSEKPVIPWYVMTSGPTDAPTQEFFEMNNYFGIPKEQITFFQQGVLPCLDFEGKIMLESKGKVAVAPDGNGGLYKALTNNGIIADMEKKGVKHVHAYCVDNVLVKVADPGFLGFAIEQGVQCAAKVVPKRSPDESVGVVCMYDGKNQVIEYSEITETTANRTNEDGSLTFNAGNIANHYYSMDYLKKTCEEDVEKLVHHVAKKKIPYADEEGNTVKTTTPNGIKMELFIFDVFPMCEKFAIYECARNEEFSPLKNAPGSGSDCPETCRQDYLDACHRWLQAAGAEMSKTAEIEISPLTSYDGEGLDEYKGQKLNQEMIL
eukprot:Clim_evm27s144 gene=Clim_evmTU27s144